MPLLSRLSDGALEPRLSDLLDVSVLQRLGDANHAATGMPISIVDALDGTMLVRCGFQDICARFHRAHPESLARCRASDSYVGAHLDEGPCEYTCRNGLEHIGVPIVVEARHLATMFLGQFFYEGEVPDRGFFVRQARQLGYDEEAYLAALDRVPLLERARVEKVVAYDVALARFVSETAARALAHARVERALRDADERKSEFLGVLSHELRNPLAPIRNALRIMEHAPAGGEQALRARAVIGRQVDHLTRLVDDLLDSTRISRGKVELQRALLDLGQLVERTVEDHRALFAERGIVLELRIAPRVSVNADPTRIAQVLGNLLQNSAKFTPRAGRVAVSMERSGDRARVSVRDSGVGIDPAMLGTIFDPFTQADDTLHRTEGGLGLGLALVHGLVTLHGGTVEARSDGVGKGTEVAFELPVAEPARPDFAESFARPDAVPLRVLVVEDNEDSAETLREVLELSHHDVEIARDGAEGILKARAFRPDVVLCDIGLPTMDGYAVARAIRSEGTLAGTTLVALTGYALPEDQRRAREAGFDHHLAKPAPLAAIDRLLAGAARRERVTRQAAGVDPGAVPAAIARPSPCRG